MARAPVSSEQLFTNADALDHLGETWADLWSRTQPRPPMLELTWVRTWWHLHRSEGRLFVLLLRDEHERPVALAPLYIRREGFRDPRRCLRNVCFLGTGEREEDELTGEYNTWLGAPDVMARMTERVAAQLTQAAGQWDRVKLDRCCPEPGIADGLAQALAPLTLEGAVNPVATFRSPTMPLDKYIQAIPSSNFRHRCRRAMRAAKDEGLEFVRARTPEEMEEMFAAMRALHQARWSEKGHRGVFASPLFTKFHDQIRPVYLKEGRLWLVGLRKEGRWVAVRYLLRAGDRLYDYVSGVDTGTSSALAPGLVLHLFTIDACVPEKIAVYDLMAGDYDYKRKLTLEESALPTLDLRARTWRARVWVAARDLARKLRPEKPAVAEAEKGEAGKVEGGKAEGGKAEAGKAEAGKADGGGGASAATAAEGSG